MLKKLLITGLLALPLLASAIPAKRGTFTVTQPDGSQLTVCRVGDEHRHFLLTADGLILSQNASTGAYEYARIDASGALQLTGVPAKDAAVRPAADLAVAEKISDEVAARVPRSRVSKYTGRQMAPARTDKEDGSIPQNGMGLFTTSFPSNGEPHVLVILVEYKNLSFSTPNPKDYFEKMLNEPQFSEYGGTGSVKDFFSENSNGQFVPHFDLYGPVTLSQNRSYYGGNNWAGNDENPEDMIIEACRQLDDQIDFSIYDNDGDGVVDNVYVFYAGQGEASGGPDESVWPHSWELSSAHKDLKLDGVTIDRYACSNEWEGSRPDGIGTFTHEFSHVMGLPDLYTTNYNSYMTLTPGSWSVMDYGPYNNEGRTPPAYSIYERNALKWLQPRVIDGPISITLEDIKSSNDGCIVTTSKQNEFFLFENRQQTGWDTYVPGHGMLIWHIDFDQDVFDANTVNNQSHQYVDIVEACNKANNENEALMAAYPWPGTQSKTSFTADTKPAFKSYAGADLKLPITDIKETDGVITFNVDGGTPVPPPIETPTALEPADVGEDYAVVTWTPVEGATDYALYLYQQGAGEAATHTANMGAGNSFSLPEGWSSSATTIYTTSGNYGEASPSYKLSSDGAWLETPDFGADVKKVEFWTRAQNSSGGSELDLLGYKDGQWITLRQIIPSSAMAETSYNINDIPEGVTAIKFVYKKVRGNYALDDVVVTLGPSNKLLRTVESTGGETSFKFEGLDYASYLFEVTATDGEYVTPHSNHMTFTTRQSSVEMNVSTAAGEVKYFDLLGRRITAPAPGTICIEKRGATARRIIKR